MTTMTLPALRIPRFRASSASVCGSDYACEDIEAGDHVGVLAGPAGPVTLCAPCCDRTEAAAELDALDLVNPIQARPGRDNDVEPAAARNVAEAIERLSTEHDMHGQYPDEHVAVLLALLNEAAEQVAASERERWAERLRRVARRGTSLTEQTRSGLRMAAALIERNREQ